MLPFAGQGVYAWVMKTANDLRQMLRGMERAPYPVYKRLKGRYAMEGFELCIDRQRLVLYP